MGGTYDVIVIGVGTMGAAACRALARRGARVLGIDRFSPPHDRGSHHGRSRIFRVAYYEHPDYVPLLQRAHQLWRGLEAGARRPLLLETGVLYMGPPEADLIRASAGSAAAHGVEHEVLDQGELRRRFPQFTLPPTFVGLHEPHAGMVFPEAAIGALIHDAEAHGAEIARGRTVLGWSVDNGRVRVRTAAGTEEAGKLVVTAGAWAPGLLADLGVRLTPSRQPVGWFLPRNGMATRFRAAGAGGGTFPCWAIANADGSLHYGFPVTGSETALKVAHHRVGPPTDPDSVDRSPSRDDEADLRRVLAQHIPGADGPLHEMQVCLYTNTPDSHFIIDQHPAHANVVLASACSGHGFKFAPVIGEALADLALDGGTDLPIGFLGLSRFEAPRGGG
jgi:sarcosine oxidase